MQRFGFEKIPFISYLNLLFLGNSTVSCDELRQLYMSPEGLTSPNLRTEGQGGDFINIQNTYV